MSRPFKCKRIGYLPEVTIFKPTGIPLRELEVVAFSFEEAEAIRLKELEGLEQEPAAEKMNISRPTFQRILASARQKLADVIINGKAIRIEGGNYEISIRRFRCAGGHEWDMPLEELEDNHPTKCPICDTPEIFIVPPAEAMLGGKGKYCQRGSVWQVIHHNSEKKLIILQASSREKIQSLSKVIIHLEEVQVAWRNISFYAGNAGIYSGYQFRIAVL
jgi:uncharacterized protein